MKKIILATFALIVFAGCVKDLPYEDLPVPIQFNAGLSGVNTRAPINDLSSGITGIQILRAPDASSAVWTSVATVATTANVASGGGVTVNTPQYYNANSGLNAWFMAFYPVATSMSANTVNWTITGQEDIIVAPSIDAGNKASPAESNILAFDHKLSQIQFEVIANDVDAQTYWGTLSSITVNSYVDLTLTLSTPDNLASSGDPGDLSTGIASMTIPTGTAGSAGNVMVFPGTLGTVQVLTSTMGETPQTVTNISLETITAGHAHLITLTFYKSGAIGFSATLTDWVDGFDGTGSL